MQFSAEYSLTQSLTPACLLQGSSQLLLTESSSPYSASFWPGCWPFSWPFNWPQTQRKQTCIIFYCIACFSSCSEWLHSFWRPFRRLAFHTLGMISPKRSEWTLTERYWKCQLPGSISPEIMEDRWPPVYQQTVSWSIQSPPPQFQSLSRISPPWSQESSSPSSLNGEQPW